MKKLFLYIILLLLPLSALWAQRPVITGISPKTGTVNEVITISGSDLPAGTAAHVQFGAARGRVVEATSSQIKVKVPAGATYEGVTVTNLTTGLAGKWVNPFQLSFGGASYDPAKIAADLSFYSGAGMFDLCTCDFNGDSLVDVVTTNTKALSPTLYTNKTTPGAATIAMMPTSIPIGGAYSRNAACEDMDGDGRTDLIIVGDGAFSDRIYLLRNLSSQGGSITFSAATPITLSSTGAGRVAIRDLNDDGRPEILLTTRSANTDTGSPVANMLIFRNASYSGTLQFDQQPQVISIAAPASSTYGISVQDLDGDGKADVALTPYLGPNVYTLRNTSSGGAISFSNGPVLSVEGSLIGVVAADLTGDGKPELAATDFMNDKVYVWPNTSASGSIGFGALSTVVTRSAANTSTTPEQPWGIKAGDINGDGRTDLFVSNVLMSTLVVITNEATNGSLQLKADIKVTAEKGRNLAFADFNKDAKPDLAYTGYGGNLRILRNMHCVVPRLQPSGTVTLCSGQTIMLKATNALAVTYKWTRDGVVLTATGSSLTVSEAGNYVVTISSAADGCALSSEAVQVVSGSGAGGGSVAMEPIAPVCVGGSAVLKATAISGATYVWNGPNGFTTTTTTASHTLTNVQTTAAGSYSVVIKSGECQFTPAAQTLTVNSSPQPQITASAAAFCAGTSVSLQATAGFATYQWKLNGANYTGSGATTAAITITTAGTYTVVVSNSSGCTGESAATSISQTQAPVANFNAPSTACLQQPVALQNTSTYTGSQVPTYLWTFGDGETSTEANPSHIYTTTGTYTINLTAKYGAESCSHSTSKTISVVASPDVQLLAAGSTTICPGDSVQLLLDGDVSSVLWSTGETSLSIYAKESGTYSANIVTSSGCTLERTVLISHLEQPQLSLSASAESIKLGETVTLTVGGALQYEWQEAEGITDPYSHTVEVAPLKTTTYQVKGWGENGCATVAEITIVVDNSLRINPPKIFVPAVDGFWTIADIELYPELTLSIVNSVGRTIYAAKPYSNNWDGTEAGKAVEPGVYYYIFKDGSAKVLKTGSITLLR